jgi:V-type H+-transporting ATPase subunit F
MSATTSNATSSSSAAAAAAAAAVAASSEGSLLAVIGDEDTVTGFLLAGVGNVDARRKSNFLIVKSDTSRREMEDAFKEFTTREDVAVVLIAQFVANEIRYLVNEYTEPIPAVLEIPSPDHPYDPSADSILKRVKHLLGAGDGV